MQVWGAQLRLLDLAPPLAERGVRLTLAAAPDSPVARAWAGRGLPLEPLELPEHRSLRRPDGRRAGPGQVLSEARAVAVSAARSNRLPKPGTTMSTTSTTTGRRARRPPRATSRWAWSENESTTS